jgi:hypothetical protein
MHAWFNLPLAGMVRGPPGAVLHDHTSGAERPARAVLRKNRRRDQGGGKERVASEAEEGKEAALSFMLTG